MGVPYTTEEVSMHRTVRRGWLQGDPRMVFGGLAEIG